MFLFFYYKTFIQNSANFTFYKSTNLIEDEKNYLFFNSYHDFNQLCQ